MDQPIPSVTAEDVERIVRRDFPPDAFDKVMAMLNEYGTLAWQREPVRVRLAALKLAKGKISELRRYVELAKVDCRDVLAPAEYPNYLLKGPGVERLPEVRRNQAVEDDWNPYTAWLTCGF